MKGLYTSQKYFYSQENNILKATLNIERLRGDFNSVFLTTTSASEITQVSG